MMDFTQTQIAVKPLTAIPAAKRRGLHFKTAFGVLGGIGALFLPKLGFPWQVALAVAGFCGFVASKQLVLTYAKAIPAFIADVVNALKGQKPNGTPPA